MINYKWKLCNGQAQQMFDHFKFLVKFEEKQVYAEGLIKNIEQFYLSPKDTQLTLYMQFNKEAYETYWKSIIGNKITIPQTTCYIQQYINENNLIDDFHKFIEQNYHLFINYKSKQEILQTLIDKVMQPIFADYRNQYFFIYRDRDNKGIYIEKPLDKNMPNLLKLLEQFRDFLSYCIINYEPENGDKKRILDMMQKISNFREIYFLSSEKYNALIDLFDKIKINLRKTFNPNRFLIELNDLINDVFYPSTNLINLKD